MVDRHYDEAREGGIVHLPFEWPEDPTAIDIHPPEPSPIAKLIGQGKVANPADVLGQGKWRDIDAILTERPYAGRQEVTAQVGEEKTTHELQEEKQCH